MFINYTETSNPDSGATALAVTSPDLSVAQVGSSTYDPELKKITVALQATLAVGSQTANTFYASPDGSAGTPTFRAIVAEDIPTLNQDTTGTAAGLSDTLGITSGGTGQTTQQAAINALTGTQVSGTFVRSNGINASLDTIKSNDVAAATTGYTTQVGGTITLTSSSNNIQMATGNAVTSFLLPNATTLTINRTFTIYNRAVTNVGNIKNASGTILLYMPPGLVVKAICTSISTSDGTWAFLSAYDSWVPSTATGYGNMTLGVQSGRSLSTAANVTVFGGNAYITATTAGNASAYGYQSLASATGIGNQAFGYASGSAITTGPYNVYIGSYTGNTLSHATASNNVILSDGQANIVFIANGTTQAYNVNTTWTPADASGATLSFTVTNANYSSISNWVRFTTTLAYPVTADTSAAVISGLPRAVANQALVQCFSAGLGIGLIGVISASGTSIALYNVVTGAAVTNNLLSGATLTISSVYNT